MFYLHDVIRVLSGQHDFLFSRSNLLLFDFAIADGKPALLVVTGVVQRCLARGRTTLTLGRPIHYCAPTTSVPFRASSASSVVLLAGAVGAAV